MPLFFYKNLFNNKVSIDSTRSLGQNNIKFVKSPRQLIELMDKTILIVLSSIFIPIHLAMNYHHQCSKFNTNSSEPDPKLMKYRRLI